MKKIPIYNLFNNNINLKGGTFTVDDALALKITRQLSDNAKQVRQALKALDTWKTFDISFRSDNDKLIKFIQYSNLNFYNLYIINSATTNIISIEITKTFLLDNRKFRNKKQKNKSDTDILWIIIAILIVIIVVLSGMYIKK